MNAFRRIKRSNFFIKLKSWEYWPFGIVQAPLILYWLWLSLKARSLFFFSASNPGILTGGMFGESKFDVLKKIPANYKPTSILISVPCGKTEIKSRMKEAGLTFPVIFKPDLGERGWMVNKIKDDLDLDSYLEAIKINFIIQEFVSLPLEFSVFYEHHPDKLKGVVTSVTAKKMLLVTGDGVKTLQQLILELDRAKLQWDNLKILHRERLNDVLPKNQEMELVSIGNHCLGTTFINSNSLINENLSDAFDQLSKQIDGFYFGRYDLRTASLEDLEKGNVMIMELNGCGAEPSHIYHPGASLIGGIRDLFVHWHSIYTIGKANHKRGIAYLSFKEGIAIFRKFKAATTS